MRPVTLFLSVLPLVETKTYRCKGLAAFEQGKKIQSQKILF